MVDTNLKTLLSGIQPTSIPHLGNYLGAICPWVRMQENYRCYFMIVNLHALTVPQDPKELHQHTFELAAYYLASGLNPERVSLFLQSHVHEHAELGWVLTCHSYMGELSRMTQYKDKSQKQGQNIGAGLFVYPALMAADILLYQPHFIPVGDDQKQHVELARNLAERFNNRVSEQVFRVPEPMIPVSGARVMDLQDPDRKMSKSAENPKGVLYLNDSDKDIEKKIKSAVTDSGSGVVPYEQAGSGLRNLLDINAVLSNRKPEVVAEEFVGKQYGHIKVATAELAVQCIGPIRDEAARYLRDRGELERVLRRGADAAQQVAAGTLKRVYTALGLA